MEALILNLSELNSCVDLLFVISGVYVKDLLSFVTKSVKEIEHVMNVGNQNRSVGATNMNEHRLEFASGCKS